MNTTKTDNLDFKERLSNSMSKLGLSKKELSEKLKIPLSNIYEWTSKRGKPSTCIGNLIIEHLQLAIDGAIAVDIELIDGNVFCNRINELKDQLNLTIIDLSKLIDAPYITIQSWVNKKRTPPVWVSILVIQKLERIVFERGNKMINSLKTKK